MPVEGRTEIWRQFVVTGRTASISSGGSVTEAKGEDRFSGPPTIILGRNLWPQPNPTTDTIATWDILVDQEAIASLERAFVVVSCIRTFGGLHSLVLGCWARIWFNEKRLDAFRLMIIPLGHSDYFHRPPVPELPGGFVFSDSQTKYSWPITRSHFVEEPTQRLRVQIDPEVRWDIDHVAIIISKAVDTPTVSDQQVSFYVSQYNNYGQVGAMGDNATSHDNTFTQTAKSSSPTMNVDHLSEELDALRTVLAARAKTEADQAAMAMIGHATAAAHGGDLHGAMGYLKAAGKWALDVAKEIGKDVAAKALTSALGRPPG